MSFMDEEIGGVVHCKHGNMVNDLNWCNTCDAIDSIEQALHAIDTDYIDRNKWYDSELDKLRKENEELKEKLTNNGFKGR